MVYALVESKKSGLYKSDDGGYSWKLVNGQKSIVDNRPFYFQDIISDPLNENTLWYISQTVQKSIDGGKNFETVFAETFGMSWADAVPILSRALAKEVA